MTFSGRLAMGQWTND